MESEIEKTLRDYGWDGEAASEGVFCNELIDSASDPSQEDLKILPIFTLHTYCIRPGGDEIWSLAFVYNPNHENGILLFALDVYGDVSALLSMSLVNREPPRRELVNYLLLNTGDWLVGLPEIFINQIPEHCSRTRIETLMNEVASDAPDLTDDEAPSASSR